MKAKIKDFAGYILRENIGDIVSVRNIDNGFADLYVTDLDSGCKFWFIFPPNSFEIVNENN